MKINFNEIEQNTLYRHKYLIFAILVFLFLTGSYAYLFTKSHRGKSSDKNIVNVLPNNEIPASEQSYPPKIYSDTPTEKFIGSKSYSTYSDRTSTDLSVPTLSKTPNSYLPQPLTTPPEDRSSNPAREAKIGICECPYDRDRNNRLCGKRTAYNKPGGSQPICYAQNTVKNSYT